MAIGGPRRIGNIGRGTVQSGPIGSSGRSGSAFIPDYSGTKQKSTYHTYPTTTTTTTTVSTTTSTTT